MTTSNLVGTAFAAQQLGVSVSWLRSQKAAGSLKPLEHWLYATGRPGGRVLWKLDAIHRWREEQMHLFFADKQKLATEIEVYAEPTQRLEQVGAA